MGRPLSPSVGPAWFLDLERAWLASLRRRNKASTSVKTYRWHLRSFGAWLLHCRVEAPAHLIPIVLESWQDQLCEAGLSASSRQLAASVIRGILRFGSRDHGLPPELWERVEAVDRPEGEPRPIEPEDLAQLLAHLARPRRRDLEALRDRALFLFLLTSGSRISAALSLQRDQVRAGIGRVIVRQKGGSEHTLVFSSLAQRWLAEHLAARGRDDEPALWIRRGPRGRHRLHPAQVNALWSELCDTVRVPRFTSHQLKHTSATELSAFTGSDAELAEHIGWRDLGMVRRYRRVAAARRQILVDQLDQLVPIAVATPAPLPRPSRARRAVVMGGRPRPAP